MNAGRLLAPGRIAAIAAAFALLVIVFGAFVRLSHAGLSCPEWPTCYGKATWPVHAHEIAHANEAFPQRPFEDDKAWREQVHRMLAGTLGLLVFGLALRAARSSRLALAALVAAAVAAALGVAAYMKGAITASSLLSAFAIALPLVVAARLRVPAPLRVAVAVFALVILQAMLGMWTVTLLLKPIVVMGHLLGGLLTFALLAWVAFALAQRPAPTMAQLRLRPWIVLALAVVAVQIALGGWTSANYAALSCGIDFPKCAGLWWPWPDFREGFVLWRGIGVNYEGGVLDAPARIAIQLAHRIGAVVTFVVVLATAITTWHRGLRTPAAVVALLLCAQVVLGILNVKLLLPLPVATAHNGVAALLLLALIGLLARVQEAGIRDS